MPPLVARPREAPPYHQTHSLPEHIMSNDFLSQILGSVLGGASGGQQGVPGGLGNVLGGMFGGGRQGDGQEGAANDSSPLGGKGALLAMLLPLAMQWVQRNGGIGAVLERFQQKGHSQQVASWISTGDNQPVSAEAVGDVVGMDELSRLSQQLGVSNDQVASGLAQILPNVVNHLTPGGHVPQDADDALGAGLAAVQEYFGRRGT